MAGPNQPGGRFAPCAHPSVSGRERELRALSDGVRRLITAAVTTDADGPTTADFAARVERLAARLEARVPDPAPPRLHTGATTGLAHGGSPYDVVHGLYNPIAPPLEMTYTADGVTASATFGPAHEGPPGRVHGAMIVAAFDMVLSSANVVGGITGPTGRLRVYYDHATRLGVPARFEGRQERVEGRKIHSVGRLLQGGRVTCRAEGLFIALDRDGVEAMGVDSPGTGGVGDG